ncbi:hypothetical protein [Flammeovirga aprica]|uniref:Urease accessory protein UreH-like transmembrane domain-containing protein n=1 Tax=Flammeovirga aprica JL-4 TaxID=694437 RepID=A0A7X9XBR4_9BACT|nr:hypothetical protein [Flammeovirga aprica]NME71005.1 hypothetical protein [Flammeovirga aprica JL-4]
MLTESFPLLLSALSIGVIHTISGPDHYMPFVALAKTKNWSTAKTLNVVAICGIGHVIGSITLGLLGVALGWSVSNLEIIEGQRGSIASWFLLIAGLLYAVYGIYTAVKNKTHSHVDTKKSLSFWVIFIIFAFGPCEPLIPLLMYPAAQLNIYLLGAVTFVFATATIGTMLTSVYTLTKGISLVHWHKLERFSHLIGGATIMMCGAGMVFLGL